MFEEMKGKKLKQLILKMKKSNPTEMLKIGANDGSQFYFIGTAAELEAKHEELELFSIKAVKTKTDNTIAALNDAVAGFRDQLEKCENDPKKYRHLAQSALKKIKDINKRLTKFCDTEEIFEPIMERTITDIFKSNPVIDNSTIVYIDGIEVGSKWFVGGTEEKEAYGALSKV